MLEYVKLTKTKAKREAKKYTGARISDINVWKKSEAAKQKKI